MGNQSARVLSLRGWVVTLGLTAWVMAGGASADVLPEQASPGAGLSEPPVQHRTPDVTLVWTDINRLVPTGFEDVASAVVDLFADAGVAVGWRRVSEPSNPISSNDTEIPIVVMAGIRPQGSGRQHTLAATWREGPPPRPIWIYPAAIRWTLGLGRTQLPLSSGDCRSMAKPLARVIAHEVLHSLEPRRAHARHGLMSAVYTRDDLLTETGPLDVAEVRRFLEKITTIADARRTESREETARN
jgi:hypothetical protein